MHHTCSILRCNPHSKENPEMHRAKNSCTTLTLDHRTQDRPLAGIERLRSSSASKELMGRIERRWKVMDFTYRRGFVVMVHTLYHSLGLHMCNGTATELSFCYKLCSTEIRFNKIVRPLFRTGGLENLNWSNFYEH